MIVSINSGSSSIKFSFFNEGYPLRLSLHGEMERIGNKNTTLSFIDAHTEKKDIVLVNKESPNDAIVFLVDFLSTRYDFNSVTAIGHRIVHGMQHRETELVTPDLLRYLKGIGEYDPEHLPQEIRLIELFTQRHPTVRQLVCFDTAFHKQMPLIAKMLPLPRRYYAQGIQRYGFHGLSYAYLMEELANVAGKEIATGKIILAHLGSGASLAAVREGKSIDTSMGFTPSSGLMMGTRTGDLDPGIARYLMEVEKLTPSAYSTLINHESGLLGISETSSDMRELMKCKYADSRASEAVDLFCYQVKKWIGSFAAVLDGLDTLVFSGGIGEHSPEVRSITCNHLTFLGIALDETRNKNNEAIISTDSSKVQVRVIKTNEELMIARLVHRIITK